MKRAVFAALAATAACSDPKPFLLDAGPDASDPLARCLVPASYGALGARAGTPSTVGTGNPALTVVLDAGPPKDDFFVRLVAGSGAFAAGLRTGTFAITGADAEFARCGLCVTLIADIVAGQGPTKFYAATAGSVTLTATAPVAGSASDLRFTEVTVDGAPVPGGCTSSVASIAFGP